MESPTTLLGHPSHFGSFSTQSELLCTQGLAYLLQTHEDARSALADEVEARTLTDVARRSATGRSGPSYERRFRHESERQLRVDLAPSLRRSIPTAESHR